MRRKAGALNPLSPSALSDDSTGPKSPASTGAMDDLLQKLRAAKPEAKDQRDRRRRARLKDRHQVRVASGQKIPELGVNVDENNPDAAASSKGGVLSPKSDTADSTDGTTSITSPTDGPGSDVADRAAAMLEGLQGGLPAGTNKDGSLAVRRRRENADSERERRRRRRQQASSAAGGGSGEAAGGSIAEEGGEDALRSGSIVSGDGTDEPATPITVVHPPSPEQKRERGEGAGPAMLTPPPEG